MALLSAQNVNADQDRPIQFQGNKSAPDCNPDVGIEPRASKDQQSKKWQELIGRSRLLHSNRLQEDINRCHAEFGTKLETELASERVKLAEELEQEIAASRAEYDELLKDEIERLRETSIVSVGAKLVEIRSESKALLEEHLRKLRADGSYRSSWEQKGSVFVRS